MTTTLRRSRSCAGQGDGLRSRRISGPAQIAAENVLLKIKASYKEVLGIERGVAEILPRVSVEGGSAALHDRVDVAVTIAALGSVIEAGADLEFLDRVGIGNRRIGEFTERVVRGEIPSIR